MNEAPTSATGGIEQRQADRLVRTFWVAANNAGLYGAEHPLTAKSLRDFHQELVGAQSVVDPVSFHVERDLLFLESVRIDPRAYSPRLVTRLDSAGVQSITFRPNVEVTDLSALLELIGNPRKYPTVGSLAEALKEKRVKGVQFNYITYQRVTVEQAVVRDDLARLAQQLSCFGLFDAAEETPWEYVAKSLEQGRTDAPVVEYIRVFRNKLKSAPPGRFGPAAVEDVAEALASLHELALAEAREMAARGNVQADAATPIDELQAMTRDVVLRIVREEYRTGSISLDRLAEIVKRLVPDGRELSRLLPELKRTLLGEGMSLEEYLRFVEQLSKLFQEGGLIDLLAQAGEEIGLRQSEVLEALRKNPDASVRLIVLASEIGSMLGADQDRYRTLLTEYLERVGAGMSRGPEEDSSDDRHTVDQLEHELVAQLETLGVQGSLLSGIRHPAPGKAASPVPGAATSGILAAGASDELPPPRAPVRLPAGMLRARETRANLAREISRHIRYGTPLSCLVLSAPRVREDDFVRPPTPGELTAVYEKMQPLLVATLRDLDIVGSPGSASENMVLVLLTMTGAEGRSAARKRIEDSLSGLVVTLAGTTLTPDIVTTESTFDTALGKDAAALLKRLKAQHRKVERETVAGK